MLFTPEEDRQIVGHIAAAEKRTSGEIRVFVEDFCFRDHPVERAAEVFVLFGMQNTRHRNAVILYLAQKSHHFAIWGDEGIHQRVGLDFWHTEKGILRTALQNEQAAAGVCAVIDQIGEKLALHFPPSPEDEDKNELPNEIIYG